MSCQGTSVTGSSHVLSLNLRLEIHIFLLLGMRIWLAYLDRGRTGPCDGTPKRRGGGEFTSGDGELLEEMLNNAQPSRCSWSPSSRNLGRAGSLSLVPASTPPSRRRPHVLLCLHLFHFSFSADRPPGLTHLLQNGILSLQVLAPK